jgi:hypothetical protein
MQRHGNEWLPRPSPERNISTTPTAPKSLFSDILNTSPLVPIFCTDTPRSSLGKRLVFDTLPLATKKVLLHLLARKSLFCNILLLNSSDAIVYGEQSAIYLEQAACLQYFTRQVRKNSLTEDLKRTGNATPSQRRSGSCHLPTMPA